MHNTQTPVDFFLNYDFESLCAEYTHMYLYDQYTEINPAIKKLFNYFNDELKKRCRINIALWFIYKSNQNIENQELKPQEYFSYLQYHYRGFKQLFGVAFIDFHFDRNEAVWDQPEITWDHMYKSGTLDMKRTKAVYRYINNLQQKVFNIFDFVNMCNEFAYDNPGVSFYIDDTSFDTNPYTIKVYYTEENQAKNILIDVMSVMKDNFPYIYIDFVLKPRTRKMSRRGRPSKKKSTEE